MSEDSGTVDNDTSINPERAVIVKYEVLKSVVLRNRNQKKISALKEGTILLCSGVRRIRPGSMLAAEAHALKVIYPQKGYVLSHNFRGEPFTKQINEFTPLCSFLFRCICESDVDVLHQLTSTNPSIFTTLSWMKRPGRDLCEQELKEYFTLPNGKEDLPTVNRVIDLLLLTEDIPFSRTKSDVESTSI